MAFACWRRHCRTGRRGEAHAALRRARTLDPLNLETVLDHAASLAGNGEVQAALDEFRQLVERFPETARVRFRAGVVYLPHGSVDDARHELKAAVRLAPKNPRFAAHLAYAEARAGNREAAQQMLAQLVIRTRTEYLSPVSMALIHAALDEREAAIALIATAYRQRAVDLPRVAQEQGFRGLRDDRRVREILSSIGLPR